MSSPTGLDAHVNSNEIDVELTWDISGGNFNGYQILKSVGNNYSFEVIDSVLISALSYIDENALLKDEEKY
ncbi:unnamed protein product, partial [marine sediment metagenome]